MSERLGEHYPAPDDPELEVIRELEHQSAISALISHVIYLVKPHDNEMKRPTLEEGDINIELLPQLDGFPAYSSICISVHPVRNISEEDVVATIRLYEDMYGEDSQSINHVDLAHHYTIELLKNKYRVRKQRILQNYTDYKTIELNDKEVVDTEEIYALIGLIELSPTRKAEF